MNLPTRYHSTLVTCHLRASSQPTQLPFCSIQACPSLYKLMLTENEVNSQNHQQKSYTQMLELKRKINWYLPQQHRRRSEISDCEMTKICNKNASTRGVINDTNYQLNQIQSSIRILFLSKNAAISGVKLILQYHIHLYLHFMGKTNAYHYVISTQVTVTCYPMLSNIGCNIVFSLQ